MPPFAWRSGLTLARSELERLIASADLFKSEILVIRSAAEDSTAASLALIASADRALVWPRPAAAFSESVTRQA